MKQIITIIIILLLILTGCSSNQMKHITIEQVTDLQKVVLDFIIEDKAFGVNGCYSYYDEDSGLNTMCIEAYEEAGVEYEAYKEKIWDATGEKFNIVFELIPFPEVPTITGVIRDIEDSDRNNLTDYMGTILIVSQTSDFVAANGNPYFDASRITVVESVEIVNQTGEKLEFSELREGMMVDSYYRGITLETYPGQQGTEKLVVYENYKMPMVSDQVDEVVFINKFDSINYTGPYPVIVEGYRYEKLLDYWRSKILFYMDYGMIYYDVEKGFHKPQLYIGNLNWTFVGEEDVYMTGYIEGVLIRSDEEIVLSYDEDEDTVKFQIPVFEAGKKQMVIYKLDRMGNVERIDE